MSNEKHLSNPRKSQRHMKLQLVLGYIQDFITGCEDDDELATLRQMEEETEWLIAKHPS